jgi:hypothetical protein
METKDLKTHRSGQLHIKPYEELMVNQILGKNMILVHIAAIASKPKTSERMRATHLEAFLTHCILVVHSWFRTF